jgi:hypothetical protein
VDITADGFWGLDSVAFFDLRIFNPFSQSYLNFSQNSLYRKHEQEKRVKRRQYDHQIQEIEQGSFTPLIFSTAGGTSPATTIFLKKILFPF